VMPSPMTTRRLNRLQGNRSRWNGILVRIIAWNCGACINWTAFGCHGGSIAEVAERHRYGNAFTEKEFNGVIRQQGSLPLAQLPCRKAVRRAGRALRAVTRPTPNSPGTFFVAQSWAGCIIDMPRFNLRQAQATTELRPPPFRS
jgi:hypothetical protein